jgi:hypothetical protein
MKTLGLAGWLTELSGLAQVLSPFFGETLPVLHKGLMLFCAHRAVPARRQAGQAHLLATLAANDRGTHTRNPKSVMNGRLKVGVRKLGPLIPALVP